MATTPATNETAGPFRKVVEVVERPAYPDSDGTPSWWERLECGHWGNRLRYFTGGKRMEAKARRRCWYCREVPT